MKSQLSSTAIGIVLVTTALGFAIFVHLPSFLSRNTAAASIGSPYRVYCYNGMTGKPGSLHRGWVCLPQQTTTSTN